MIRFGRLFSIAMALPGHDAVAEIEPSAPANVIASASSCINHQPA